MSLLEASGIHFAYGDQPVLRDASIAVEPGQLVGLIGPNGAGKTSLLKIAAGLLEPAAGELRWGERSLQAMPAPERARYLGYLPQGAPAHWPLSVERVVELGRVPHRAWWQRLSDADQQAIERAFAQADIDMLRGRIVTTLSGGERARVMLARVFATRPQVILADEPVASLDPFHQLQVMETLREHAATGGGVLVVLHDLNLAARYCDRLLLLDRGAVVAEGTTRQVLDDPALASTYAVSVEVLEDDSGLWVRYRGESPPGPASVDRLDK